jgi:tetratricopeptide (TPR) repeat protein
MSPLDDAPTKVTGENVEPHSSKAPKETFDRYTLISMIGAGGMGEVWKAYDPVLGRVVAIKRVFGKSASKVEAQRLHREAQAIAQLSHPNVIAVFDVGVAEGELFMAMEHVEGLPLGRFLEIKRRGRDATLAIFLQAARGLAALHDAGLVHRDFKPSNVLVGEDGRVRVLDFGLARRVEIENRRPAATYDTASDLLEEELTREGAISGTPRYMAPEQFLQLEIGGRSDQFAFGIALYEALTFTRPFDGDTTLDLARNVVRGRVKPISEDLSLPPWLTSLIFQCLKPRASDRLASMHEVIKELERDRAASRHATLDGSSMSDILTAFPPPEDPVIAPRVRWLRERLDYALKLKKEGDYAGALALCRVVVKEAEGIDYPPLFSAALYMLGGLEHRTGDPASAVETLYRGAELASRAEDDWQVANIWVFLVRVLGEGLSRYAEADAIARVAEVALARIGDNPSLRSRLLVARGQNFLDQGRALDALRAYEVALGLDEETHGPSHPLVALTLSHVGDALLRLDRPALARERLTRALEICESAKKEGPTYATCLWRFGCVCVREGDTDRAGRAFARAEQIFRRYPDRLGDLEAVVRDARDLSARAHQK